MDKFIWINIRNELNINFQEHNWIKKIPIAKIINIAGIILPCLLIDLFTNCDIILGFFYSEILVVITFILPLFIDYYFFS